MRRLALALLAIAVAVPPQRAGAFPIHQDPLGALLDVTDRWAEFQPADRFCMEQHGFDVYTAITGDTGPTCSPGQILVTIGAPPLCPGCRRLFIDYSTVLPNDVVNLRAHGHFYFRMQSLNPTYTADPIAHSPNIKNFTNDKLIAPYDSPQEQIATGFDTHAISYVGDTKETHHNEIQGPYYIGPAYYSLSGRRINGAYVDVDVSSAYDMRNSDLNGIGYWTGFDSGGAVGCPHNLTPYADADAFYFGCTPHAGMSSTMIDPFA